MCIQHEQQKTSMTNNDIPMEIQYQATLDSIQVLVQLGDKTSCKFMVKFCLKSLENQLSRDFSFRLYVICMLNQQAVNCGVDIKGWKCSLSLDFLKYNLEMYALQSGSDVF